jgi:hypothetical protein
MYLFLSLTKARHRFNKRCLTYFLIPNPLACVWLSDDLYHAKSLIEHESNKPMCDYLRQFLTGVAKSVGDTHLERAAQNEPIEDLGSIIDQKIREVRIF